MVKAAFVTKPCYFVLSWAPILDTCLLFEKKQQHNKFSLMSQHIVLLMLDLDQHLKNNFLFVFCKSHKQNQQRISLKVQNEQLLYPEAVIPTAH